MHSSVMVPPLPKAIEGFALMVKQTAQMLQSFGTELAETELPNDVPSTTSVLCAHTEKKDKAKVRVASVGDGGEEGPLVPRARPACGHVEGTASAPGTESALSCMRPEWVGSESRRSC